MADEQRQQAIKAMARALSVKIGAHARATAALAALEQFLKERRMGIRSEKRSDAEFLKWAGTDARKWAEGFLDIFPTGCADEGTLIGWFANAIEAGSDAAIRAKVQNDD